MQLFKNMKDWEDKGERVVTTLDDRHFDLHNDCYITDIKLTSDNNLVFTFTGKYYRANIDELSEEKNFQITFYDIDSLNCTPTDYLSIVTLRTNMDDFLYRYDSQTDKGHFVWTEDTGSSRPDSQMTFNARTVEFSE